MAQRFRLLWHPISIVAGVGSVSVVISVLGELLFNSGRAGVPAMLRKRPHAQLQAANPENSNFQPFAKPRTGTKKINSAQTQETATAHEQGTWSLPQ
jgi:hypothetical protein